MKYKIKFWHGSWNQEVWADSIADAANQLGCNQLDLVEVNKITENEFILLEVPVEFKGPFSQMAYERGHSAGESEVTEILRGLVADLLPAIKDFQKRIELTTLKGKK